MLAGLTTVARTMNRCATLTKKPRIDVPGTDAQTLYATCAWMAPILEEVLYSHVATDGAGPLALQGFGVRRYIPTFLRLGDFLLRRPPRSLSPAHRLTKRRYAGILEHLSTLKRWMEFVADETKINGGYGASDAQELWLAYAWMSPVLEELLVQHAIIAESVTPEDEAPAHSLRDRFRGIAGGAFGRATSGGAPGEKGA